MPPNAEIYHKVPCPRCFAWAGKPCVTTSSTKPNGAVGVPQTALHQERVNFYYLFLTYQGKPTYRPVYALRAKKGEHYPHPEIVNDLNALLQNARDEVGDVKAPRKQATHDPRWASLFRLPTFLRDKDRAAELLAPYFISGSEKGKLPSQVMREFRDHCRKLKVTKWEPRTRSSTERRASSRRRSTSRRVPRSRSTR